MRGIVEIVCAHVDRDAAVGRRLLDIWTDDGGRWGSGARHVGGVNEAEVVETRRGWEFTCRACGRVVRVRHRRLVDGLTNRAAAGETCLDLRELAENDGASSSPGSCQPVASS